MLIQLQAFLMPHHSFIHQTLINTVAYQAQCWAHGETKILIFLRPHFLPLLVELAVYQQGVRGPQCWGNGPCLGSEGSSRPIPGGADSSWALQDAGSCGKVAEG